MQNFGFIFLLMVVPALASEKLTITGEGFDKEGKVKKYTYERYQSVEGDKTLDRAVFKDLEGKILLEEKMERVKDQLVRMDVDQKQINQQGSIEVSGSSVTFNLFKPRKKNYPQVYDFPKNFVVNMQIAAFIRDNWEKIKGSEVPVIKLGVWYRQEIIGFELSKESLDAKHLVVRMRPSSILVRTAVNPVYFTFDVTTKNLLSYKGRATPKEKIGAQYGDFETVVNYTTLN